MERVEIKEEPILRSGFETNGNQSRESRNFLKSWALQREGNILLRALQQANNELNPHLKFTDKRSREKWDNLTEKVQVILTAGEQIEKKIAESDLYGANAATHAALILDMAKTFLIEETFRKREKLAKTDDKFCSAYGPFKKIGLFYYCDEVFVKIHGFNASEIIEQDRQISPSDYFSLQMKANLIASSLIKDKNKQALKKTLIESNDDASIGGYPKRRNEQIDQCCRQIASLTAMTPEYFNDILNRLFPNMTTMNDAEKEILQKARKIVEKTSALSQKIFNTILAPNSSEFPSLRNALEAYLNGENLYEKTIALFILRLTDSRKILKPYRKAREFALRNETYSLFYEQFGNCIKDYLDQFPQADRNAILTKEDTIMFLNDENQQNKFATFADFKSIIKDDAITRYIRQQQGSFPVDPQTVENWQGIIKPQAVLVVFSEGKNIPNIKINSGEIKIFFSYEGEEGEKHHLLFTINTGKEEIEWDFLEDPNDPEMQEMKNAVMLSVKSALQNVKEQIESANQQRQSEKKDASAFQLPETKAKKTKEEIYVPREKFEKPERPKPLTPLQQTLQETIETSSDAKVKKQIVFPKDETAKKRIIAFMETLTLEERESIEISIRRFNEEGIGSHQKLADRWDSGKQVYSLKKVGRHKQFRVLTVESDSKNGNGVQHEIFEIGRRRDILKKR